jgi:flagella basal body P-ring formation protein FlgA
MSRAVIYIIFAFLAQALLGIASGALAVDGPEEFRISLKPKTTISGSRIYLSDLARCSGDLVRCKEISGIDIGQSPSPGRSSFYHKSNIEEILAKEWPGVEVLIDGSDSVRAEANAVEITHEDLRQRFEDKLVKGLSARDDVRVRVLRFQPIGQVLVRPSQSKIEFPEVKHFPFNDRNWVLRNLVGNRPVQFLVSNQIDSDDKLSFSANAVVVIEMRLPVLKQSVSAGESLKKENLGSGWIQMRRGYQDLAFSEGQLLGRKARQALSSGEPIPVRFLDSPLAVSRNQTLRMVVRSGGLEISTRAISQQAGAIGQTIDVVNASTKKKVRAKIIDDQTVEAVSF